MDPNHRFSSLPSAVQPLAPGLQLVPVTSLCYHAISSWHSCCFSLCSWCHTFIKNKLLICSLHPHLHFQGLSLATPFMLPCLLEAAVWAKWTSSPGSSSWQCIVLMTMSHSFTHPSDIPQSNCRVMKSTCSLWVNLGRNIWRGLWEKNTDFWVLHVDVSRRCREWRVKGSRKNEWW